MAYKVMASQDCVHSAEKYFMGLAGALCMCVDSQMFYCGVINKRALVCFFVIGARTCEPPQQHLLDRAVAPGR